jgi:hypothetical protein
VFYVICGECLEGLVQLIESQITTGVRGRETAGILETRSRCTRLSRVTRKADPR